MDTETRLEVFRELINCVYHFPLWRCDEEFTILDDPDDSWVVGKLFLARGQTEAIREFFTEHRKPLILTGFAGLMWIVMAERDGEKIIGYSVLGPALVNGLDGPAVESEIHTLGQPVEREKMILRFVKKLSVIPLSRIMEAAIMLFFCITGERIAISDLHYRETVLLPPREEEADEETAVHGTWAAEQEMLRMVREGNIAYREQMQRVATAGTIGSLARGDSMRQMKNAVEVCITLFSRAAIEGGLPPETGMTLCDRYFQSVEMAHSVSELTDISHTMQEDFVQRVHQIRAESEYSRPIQTAIDYIDLHLEEPLHLQDLASMAGYSDYYFTRKFKEETGLAPKEYIREKRLDWSRFLLRTTNDSIQEISGRVQFCSSSYFSDHFKRAYGVTPCEYRGSRRAEPRK